MPEQPFDNDNTGEQQHVDQPNNEFNENSPANNNEQSDDEEEDDDENQMKDEDEEKEEEEPTPDFSEEYYGSDLPDDVLCPELMAERPKEHESLNNIIVVDNLPKVDQVKLEKLKAVISKVYSKIGVCRNEYYPLDEEGKTKGYGFFEFQNEQMAVEAVKQTDGYRLDKNHTFSVNLMSEFDRLTQVPPEPVDTGNLFSWLAEPDAVDEFAVQSDDPKKTTIYANALSQPIVLEDRSKWTENNFVWSPKGTYLASFHEQGIAFWGGKEFRQVQRFAHRGVNYIDFSPGERYLVTMSPRPNNPETFIVWDIVTGQKKRSFPLDQHFSQGPSYFKWSFQDQYFAKQGPDGIYMYDKESFQLVDKKPFKMPSLADFQWSPTDNRLAYWTAEDGNVPARLVLAEINGVKLEEVRSKTLFNVIDCKLCWQKRGDYLVGKVDRYTKKSGEKNNPKYSGLIYNFEIFHMREKNVPLDTLEVKEMIQSFAIEPVGHKLVVITGEGLRTNVTFYKMGQGQRSGKMEILKVITQAVTTAIWAPNGQYVVLAAMKTGQTAGGQLIFVDASDMSIMSKQEHPDLSDVEWDPTGRYVTSYVNLWSAKRDHSFKIWTFQGNLVFEKSVEKLVAFHWRPRPPSLLTEDMIREVRRNRAVWTPKLDQRDRILRTGESAKQQEQRRKQLDEFQRFKEKNTKRLAIQKQQRVQLRGGVDTDSLFEQQASNVGEEVVEFLIKTEEVEYKP
ncbi:unnamed protein product [Rotaria sp. Silwood2]|nr:unnamed protein product [Rotaria sp. Silwood2]CAF2641589.1 unnamed protein product [Rotaria sp. Silwood2]CAF2916103.1 unnamed protein product [Rotaria sp. Silwood2]CAF3050406.1 unnamed protein product [Rotaria sp. Silwood2]CAF3854640.1 unnamed protein product [Rotaria sp. Silwood2]